MSTASRGERGQGTGDRGQATVQPGTATVTVTIDGRPVKVPEGTTLLNAARDAGIAIPTLCDHEGLEPWGGCRLCVVDITRTSWEGWSKMVVSCMYAAEDGLVVMTGTERVKLTRRVVLDLLLARCPETPLIQKLAREYGVDGTSYQANPDPTDCILCALCTRVCDHLGIAAISTVNRGAGKEVAPPFHEPPPDCIGCLACAEICPTSCIPFTTSDTSRAIWDRAFEMLRCPTCGRAHITVAQADFFANSGDVPRSYFETCDACKRRQTAATFAKLQVLQGGAR